MGIGKRTGRGGRIVKGGRGRISKLNKGAGEGYRDRIIFTGY